MTKYPASRPYISQKDKKAVAQVLETDYLSLGPNHKKFEEKFAKRIGTRYAVSVSSGTAGLHLALLASGIKPGDEVITSPFSFIASSNAIIYTGAKPVFCDVDPATGNISPDEIEKKITKKTKALLIVHIFGQAANMKRIMPIAKKHNLKIIEDACESIDAKHFGKKVGTFGESAVFAFYPNKQMTTGEGGMIVTNSKKIYELCSSLRNQGRSKTDKWLEHKLLGYNYRMDELSAALGISQLEQLSSFIHKRNQIASWYSKAFKNDNDIIETPVITPHNTHTWFVYVIRLKSRLVDRDRLIELLEKSNIFTKPYLPSIHLSPYYKKRYHMKPGMFPNSEEISRVSLALPLYIQLNKKDVLNIAKKIIRIIRSYEK